MVERLTAAAEEGGSTLFVSGVDPGWGNDALAVMAAGLCTRIRSIHCQEIFDYSTYNQPHAVKVLCGFAVSMDDVPMMLLPSIRRWCGAATSADRPRSGHGDRGDHRRGGASSPRNVGRHRDGPFEKGTRAPSGSR